MSARLKKSKAKNLLPKVEFVCSWIYHSNWERWIRAYPHFSNKKYPKWPEVIRYSSKIEKKWRKVERKILKELAHVTGLNWRVEKIPCYLVGKCIPFSDPLTMHISYKTDEEFIDVLTHELIHQIFIQRGNYKRSKKAWNHIDGKYKGESFTTRVHIPLHAMHTHVLLKFFGEKRLEREVKWSKHPDYRKSWKIVDKEGYKNIIREFASRVAK